MIGKAHGAERPTITIRGPRLVLRALTPEEIDDEWLEMAQAGPMSIAGLPSEAAFRQRLERSGLEDGGSTSRSILRALAIGRIQIVRPLGRTAAPRRVRGGIGLRAHARNQGHGREALSRPTDRLFEHADAVRVQAPTDPENAAMRTAFDRVGWSSSRPIASSIARG
jgi:RimJ/RimL family protein N-acetyltransferase